MNRLRMPQVCRFLGLALAVVFLPMLALSRAQSQSELNRPPISYSTAPVNDVIARLQKRLESGETKLKWDPKHGWLPSVLKELGISHSSQLLVFSKTSLQLSKITPKRPRALYFNDEAYVGSVQFGDLLELSAVDPKQGAIFYAIEQGAGETPQIKRSDAKCLSCHDSLRSQGVPGYLVRSVYPAKNGYPHFSLGTTTTDQKTHFLQRFGGWYVTGEHGKMRHRGNEIATKEATPPIDSESGANVTDLSERFKTDRYLTPHSDLVAMLVLEHQTQMHNFITKANYEDRRSKHYDTVWNKTLKREASYVSEVSERRIANAGEKLLKYLLFSGEFQLTAPVSGTTEFAAEFEKLGPFDSQGRSLREFDLKTRLFKYPCSYLIYGESFAALPPRVRAYVDRRLEEVLSGKDQSPEFAHISNEQRTAIKEILAETLSGDL